MINSIHIPKPCHENWDNMQPEEQGRHCLSCCKTVIDFSSWDKESILAYLQNKNGERVCGRFNAEQVMAAEIAPSQQELLQGVFRSAMPLLRKIAAVIVLCFGLSSTQEAQAQKVVGKIKVTHQQPEQQLMGEPAIVQPADTAKPQPAPQIDTTRPQIMGMIAPYHPPKKEPVKKNKPKTTKKPTR